MAIKEDHNPKSRFWIMNENDISIYDRFKDVIYGQAIGDALGCAENICKLTHYDPRCIGTCVSPK